MKNKYLRKYRKERASLKSFWARAFCAVMVFSAAETLTRADRCLAADISVLETDLRSGVHDPNPAVGTPDNVLPKGFSLQRIAEGNDPLENPSDKITLFGLLSTGAHTEPDENTYLVLDHNPGGPHPRH
jgi:hypothetical protein